MAVVICTIEETTLENDDGYYVDSVEATCMRCGHITGSFGTGESSQCRCLVLMREECPWRQSNFYKLLST